MIKKELKNIGKSFYYAVAFVIGLMICLFLLVSVVLFFVTFSQAGEQSDGMAKDDPMTYKDRSYYVSSGNYDGEQYIDLTDLNVECLDYAYSGFSGNSYPLYTHDHIFLSTIDTIEDPTEEYTLSYSVWRSPIFFFLDMKEKSLKNDYDGTVEKTALDYGAKESYWLGDELLLRYDGHLLLFDEDTTKALIDNETCAEFMRTKMKMGKINF